MGGHKHKGKPRVHGMRIAGAARSVSTPGGIVPGKEDTRDSIGPVSVPEPALDLPGEPQGTPRWTAVVAAVGTVALALKENQVSTDAPSALVDVALIAAPVALVIDFVRRRKPRLDRPLRTLLLFAALVGSALGMSWTRIWVGQDAVIALAPVVCAALAARRLATVLGWLTGISCIALGVSFFVGTGLVLQPEISA